MLVWLCVRVSVCVCGRCSMLDSQQYPAADTLSGQADWLTGKSVCVRVCTCVNRQDLALPLANQCPLKGMWNLRERNWEGKKDCNRARSPGQTHFAPSPLSNLGSFIPHSQILHIFQLKSVWKWCVRKYLWRCWTVQWVIHTCQPLHVDQGKT